MNANGDVVRPQYTKLELREFDVTWAGPNPLLPGFCFGSEDGRLLFTDEQGLPIGPAINASHSGEAINGAAAIGEWIGVSTRAEVTIGKANDWNQGRVFLAHGAHGVAAAPGGYFVAPIGHDGIMLLKPGSGSTHSVAALGAKRDDRYIYRVVALKGAEGKDILACACRQSGIGITEMRWGQDANDMRVATFDGLDVVDVCAVNSDPRSPAVAAVGRDGTLILVRDGLHGKHPITIKFHAVQGTVYRLLSSGEHLFVLTSRGLYGLMKLAGRLLAGMTPGTFPTPILKMPMEAVDANLAGERWLLVVMPDEVWRFDVNAIGEGTIEDLIVGDFSESAPKTLIPDWKVSDVPQRSMALAAVP